MKGVSIMLLNKIAEARKTFEDYREIDYQLRQARKVNLFSQTAKTEINKIKGTLGSYHALHQMDAEAFQKKDFSYEIKRLESLLKTGLQTMNRDELMGFSRLFKSLDDDLKMKWTFYIGNKNKDIIGLLESLQNIVENKQEIRQLISELKTFEKKWPVTPATINRYNDHFNSANKVISEMNASTGVQDFITRVAANQATLEDLTDEVINWLRTKQLTNKLVIKFK